MATPPPGLTETGVSIAYSEKMLEDGRLDEFNDAEQSRSLRQTRRGQEIVAEKERVNENSPDHFVQKVIRARLELAGRKIGRIQAVSESQEVSAKKSATERIKKDADNIKKEVDATKIDIIEAQKIIDSLIC